jgi:uncharacterized coiled-coil protein SlyX
MRTTSQFAAQLATALATKNTASVESQDMAPPAAAPAATTEDVTTTSQEDIGAGKGALIGGIGGGIGTGYLGHKHEQKKEELHALQQQIDAKRREIHLVETIRASRESEDTAPAASTEGVGGALAGAVVGTVGTFVGGPIGSGAVGALYGSSIKDLDAKINAHKAELAKLEAEHHAKLHAAKEEFATEMLAPPTSASQEGIGHTAAGAVGGVIATGIMGHKIAKKKEELDGLKKQIEETKGKLTSAQEALRVATEAIGDTTGKGIGHGLVAGAVAGALGTGYVGHKQGQQLDELNKHITEHKAELARLEEAHRNHLNAAKEELSVDLESFFSDTPSTESAATIAGPAGGTEEVASDDVPHGVEDSLIAADDVHDQMGDICDEADRLHKASAQLESILLASYQQVNGISAESSQFVTLAVNHIVSPWGEGLAVVPSVESFGGKLSAKHATATMESNIKEVAAQFGNFLKELWAKFVALVQRFWAHLFDAATVLKRQADKLDQTARAINTDVRKESIDIGPLAHRLAVGGKVPTDVHAILDYVNFEELQRLAASTLNEAPIAEYVKSAMASENDEGHNAAFVAANAALVKLESSIFSEEGNTATHWLPGNVRFVLKNGKIEREMHEAKLENTEIPVMTRPTLIHLGQAAVKVATAAEKTLASLKDTKVDSAAMFANVGAVGGTEGEAGNGKALAEKIATIHKNVQSLVATRTAICHDVSAMITDYLKTLQALVKVGFLCAHAYGEAPVTEKVADAAKAGAAAVGDAVGTAAGATASAAQKAAAAVQGAAGGAGGEEPTGEPAAV